MRKVIVQSEDNSVLYLCRFLDLIPGVFEYEVVAEGESNASSTDRQQLKSAIAHMLRLANRHLNNDEYERFMILLKLLGQRADF